MENSSAIKLAKLLFVVPPALAVVAATRLLRRAGLLVRFGDFWSSRIGHLAGNTECYITQKRAGVQRGIDLWTHNGRISCQQLAKMIGRVLTVDPTGFTRTVMLVNTLFPGWEKHVAGPLQYDRDIFNLYERYPPTLSFTTAELARGERLAHRLGINEPWVCLIVRDSAYLGTGDHNSYRDCDIDTYADAALYLARSGYTVVRMGAKVTKPFSAKHKRIIDFAMLPEDDSKDFMTMYLGAHCEFTMSSGCGFDAIPYLFRKPIVFTNYVPFEYLQTFIQGSIAIWKHHEKDGKRMSIAEIVDSGAGQFMRADDFHAAGITLIENTPEEILAVTKEYVSQLPPENQDEFWRNFPRSQSPINGMPLHGNVRMRIGSKFLKGYA